MRADAEESRWQPLTSSPRQHRRDGRKPLQREENAGVVGFYELMIDVSANCHFEEEEAKRAKLEVQLAELSGRQRAVLKLLMAGKSNKLIATELDNSM